ncbi:MAG: helix-turn-helix domain-containing protein [Bacteroidetes bacterium]|nr:helix-turn-helix domain-containing protein [Bacteroidota bacterium]
MKNIFSEMYQKKGVHDAFSILPFDLDEQDYGITHDPAGLKDNFRIVWVKQGKGDCYVDLQQFTFFDNHLFFIRPGQMCKLQPAENVKGCVLSFAESFLNMGDPEFDSTYHAILLQLFSDAQSIPVSEDLIPDLDDALARMIKEFQEKNLFRTEILKRYLKIFFIYLTRQLENSLLPLKSTRNAEIVQRFFSLLEQQYKIKKMVADYAGMLCVTPNYLNEIVKKITGKSAGHHIRQRIVLEAKRHATYSNSCMKEIAYYLGFCDIAHFSKFFKNEAGINFTDFRKGHYAFTTVPAA